MLKDAKKAKYQRQDMHDNEFQIEMAKKIHLKLMLKIIM